MLYWSLPAVFSPDVAELGVTWTPVSFLASSDSTVLSFLLCPPLSLFSIVFYSSSFGSMFSHVFESIIVHLHVSVVLQINAQDIHYQEQLGHGNGGTVYK